MEFEHPVFGYQALQACRSLSSAAEPAKCRPPREQENQPKSAACRLRLRLELVPQRELHHPWILRTRQLSERARISQTECVRIIEIDLVESIERLRSELDALVLPFQREGLAER